jgi:hypothetical protein
MEHSILFTGHMLDKPGRATERFPVRKVGKARSEMKDQLDRIVKGSDDDFLGIAGGACGGDIVFHELCMELGIPTKIYLALSPGAYKTTSVGFAGKDWEDRFDRLLQKLPHEVLVQSGEMEPNEVWERTNDWMLQRALRNGGENMTLLALWDGKGGDGPGGTEHMIKIARGKNAEVVVIDINKV